MAVAIFTVFLVGFILGGSTVYLVENHFRTKEMNKIYKLTESLINGNDLDDSDIGKETLYSKTANQLIRLAMELTADPEKEPYVKTQISELISEENKKRSEMTEVSMDEGTGEAGVFVICKSDLMQQKETYMRGNRILLGAISIILFIAGLTNYCNVVFTGMYSRRKEFDIMKSIGMTDKQMKLMLLGESSYYFLCVMGMLFTVGVAALIGVKIYMENKLSYFTFHWPIQITVSVMLSFAVINIFVTCLACKEKSGKTN